MKKTLIFVTAALLLGLTACGEEEIDDGKVEMPFYASETEDLLCEDAESQLSDAGFTNITLEPIDDLITGWLTKDGEIEEMTVDGEDRFSEGDRYDPNVPIVISYHTFPEDEEETDEMTDTTSESTEQNTPTPTPEPTSNESIPLTVDTNSDLAAVLSNPQSDDADYSDFASTYAGQTIEFDAHVDYLQHYENYDTRYEMLISSGDWQGENTVAPGPLFKIEDFNVFEIGYNGEYLEVGDNIHVIAKVGKYNRSSSLFYLDPLTITER